MLMVFSEHARKQPTSLPRLPNAHRHHVGDPWHLQVSQPYHLANLSTAKSGVVLISLCMWSKTSLFAHSSPAGLGSRSHRFLGGVGLLTTTVQLDHFLHHIPTLGFLLKWSNFFWNICWNRFLAVHHDFHWLLIATKLLTAKFQSLYVKRSEILERSDSLLNVIHKLN